MNLKIIGSLILIALLSTSCAQTHKPANVPNTAGVRGHIVDAQQHIQAANADIKAAGLDNAAIRKLSKQIDDKAIKLDRYLETTP